MTLTVTAFDRTKDINEWDDLAGRSRNATFLHRRGYMDYHAERFADCSLIVRKGTRPFALLPANIDTEAGRVTSHGGLTYGGLLTTTAATLDEISDALLAIAEHLSDRGVKEIIYKPSPWIYHLTPAEEDLYVIFNRLGGQLTARQVSEAIDMSERIKWFNIRRRGVRKAINGGVTVDIDTPLEQFWPVLSTTLKTRHGVDPVHTLEEMQLLIRRFPTNIRLVTASAGGETLAGTVVYDTGRVAHAQYIAASAAGREAGALDLVFDRAINEYFAERRYFDFGISTEDRGRTLNSALAYQKQGFGARAVNYDVYSIKL